MIYYLLPFSQSAFLSDIELNCDIEREADSLVVTYNLLGNMAKIMIPEESSKPERKKGLWEETCFELFIAAQCSSQYREINISPIGNWNIFRFSDYRQGMEEDSAYSSLPAIISTQKDSLTLSLRIDLSRMVCEGQSINVAISAVVKSVGGDNSYYALKHTGHRADFHKRENFVVEL